MIHAVRSGVNIKNLASDSLGFEYYAHERGRMWNHGKVKGDEYIILRDREKRGHKSASRLIDETQRQSRRGELRSKYSLE